MAECSYNDPACIVHAIDDVGAPDIVPEGQDLLADVAEGVVARLIGGR